MRIPSSSPQTLNSDASASDSKDQTQNSASSVSGQSRSASAQGKFTNSQFTNYAANPKNNSGNPSVGKDESSAGNLGQNANVRGNSENIQTADSLLANSILYKPGTVPPEGAITQQDLVDIGRRFKESPAPADVVDDSAKGEQTDNSGVSPDESFIAGDQTVDNIAPDASQPEAETTSGFLADSILYIPGTVPPEGPVTRLDLEEYGRTGEQLPAPADVVDDSATGDMNVTNTPSFSLRSFITTLQSFQSLVASWLRSL